MKKHDASILFLGKANDPYCERALHFCQTRFRDVSACLGVWGDPLPEVAKNWDGDYMLSYLSRWVVPAYLIARARKASINFHPASPEYPGIGCNNFALYENAKEYGVTCHHMASKVDTGKIIAVRRFPVHPQDGVAELLERTYEHQIALFTQIVGQLAEGKDLPESDERWARSPYTREEFNAIFLITAGMSKEEIARRIRAVSYQHWQPYVELHGYRFEYKARK